MRFAPQTAAVVTGAGSGIGRSIALALARSGADVCLVGRRPEALEAVAGCARRFGVRVVCRPTDLSRDTDIAALAAAIREEDGGLHVLVHSAAVYRPGRVSESPAEDFDEQYRTNLRAPYLLTQAVLPALAEACGQVVFINSSAALASKGGCSQYVALKSGLRSMADSLRAEVNGQGVRVLSVFAGRTATPMQQAIRKHEGQPYRPEMLIQPDDVAAMVTAALLLPRSAEVTEIRVRPMIKPSHSGRDEHQKGEIE